MKKYIAGFRSDNPKNRKKAIIYYISMIIIFVIGSEMTANDISCLLILLLTPSVVMNFKQIITKKNKNEKNKLSKFESIKIFALTLIPYIVVVCLFDYTTVDVNESAVDSSTKIEKNAHEEDEVLAKEPKKEEKKVQEVMKEKSIKESEIHFINTGNSDAILIKQGDLSALIDGGDNDDEGKVVSYLKKQGVNELEYVFATHPHADHIGGLDAVVDAIPVKNVYVSNGDADTKTYSDFINSMANKGLNPSVPLLDSEFKLGTSTFKVLSVANESEPNNNSIVLLYTNGKDKVLLMGDAESEIEGRINVDDVDLIKVGHHGSHSGSSSSFIDRVKPEYAVITVGANNKYGHPHKETMDTLKNRDIEVHRSDECGQIVFKSSGNGLTVDCKVGSYNYGTDNSLSSDKTLNNTNVAVVQTPTPAPQPIPEATPAPSPSEGTVYWTPNGKSYHSTKSCSTLSRSKTILSGTQAESGKSDPCDRCN